MENGEVTSVLEYIDFLHATLGRLSIEEIDYSDYCQMTDYLDEIEKRVKQLEKKQMPMKPVIEQGAPSYYGGTSICRYYYSCPKCGGEVGRGDDKANYCHDCGQAIDWTED